MASRLQIDSGTLAEFYARYHILKLSLFGSTVRGEDGPESDVDFLVEFDPNHRPDLCRRQQLEDELSMLCGGRRVDVVNPRYLNRHLRGKILAEAEVQYTAR